jgi:hypothetical protein
MNLANKPNAENAAIGLWFHAEGGWRGGCDPGRAAKE